MENRKGNQAGSIIQGITKVIKEASSIKAEQTKLRGDWIANQLKAKQNFFFKQQERMAKEGEKRQTEQRMQQAIQSRIDTLRKKQEPITPYQDPRGRGYPGGYSGMAGVGQVKPIEPLGEEPTPRIGMGKGGQPEIAKPLGRKEYIYKRIQDKKRMRDLLKSRDDPRWENFELTSVEKKVESKYLGVAEKKEKIKAPSKKITGMIRKLKAANAPREDIEEAIRFEGYDVEDYLSELEEFQSFRGRGASGGW